MPPAPAHQRRYSAFISYRHADNTQEGRRWAEWLHRAVTVMNCETRIMLNSLPR